jgi:hypothetical protein
MSEQEDEPLVKLATAHDEVEASVWRDALAQEGIAVFIKNADPMSSFGIPPTLPYSLEILVFARDERRARWLLGRRNLEP